MVKLLAPLDAGTDIPSYAAVGVIVVHGATAGTTRPTGATTVLWIGSVEPTNAVNNDAWLDTA